MKDVGGRISNMSDAALQSPPLRAQPDALLANDVGGTRRFGHGKSTRARGAGHSGDENAEGRPRLIVVSNRVSIPSPRSASAAGGLAVALEAALREHGGIWFGWSGESRPAIDADGLDTRDVGNITFAVTDLTKRDVDEYYLGFANRALWPVCHYRLDLANYAAKDTLAYFRVNDLFARKLAPMIEPGDIIWVHDYHLMPLAAALRARGITNRIGYFHHIPWPPSELASALPSYVRILEGMGAYDVVGFQTQRDADNFGACMVEDGGAEALGDETYELDERRFRVAAFPIGIDVEAFKEASRTSASQPLVKRMAATMGDRKLVIGVDRLDYSKGIQERIRSFCAFLSTHKEERGTVTYLQVTPKSRSDVPEYKTIQEDVATRVGEANGTFGAVDWTPIRYLNQNIGHAALTGLYRMAHVGLVTPLRDGMNLVAKEYVASQNPDDPGVLILSRYAGAAAELDTALLVNPYDAVQCAAAINRALTMSRGERIERWGAMMDKLESNTVGHWWRGFLEVLGESAGESARMGAMSQANRAS
jgi:trehalose 6-phosphate synthase